MTRTVAGALPTSASFFLTSALRPAVLDPLGFFNAFPGVNFSIQFPASAGVATVRYRTPRRKMRLTSRRRWCRGSRSQLHVTRFTVHLFSTDRRRYKYSQMYAHNAGKGDGEVRFVNLETVAETRQVARSLDWGI